MPMTLVGGSPGRPDTTIRPSCGVYTPVSELNRDVLPAPFGPMMARISPRTMRIETSLRLTTPPNRNVTCSMSKTTSSAPTSGLVNVAVITSQPLAGGHCLTLDFRRPFHSDSGQLGLATSRREQASRPEDHHEHEQRADPHLPVRPGHLVLKEPRQP